MTQMTQVTRYYGDGSIIVFDCIASLSKTKAPVNAIKCRVIHTRAREVKLKPISPVITSPIEVVRQHLRCGSAP